MIPINRRLFLAQSVRGAAGLAAGTAALSARGQAPGRSANDQVLLALIGAGGRGTALAQGLLKVENVAFKYVCDPAVRQAERVAADLAKSQARPPQWVADLRQVFADREVHGVVIATPEQWHALATLWACQAGQDVYVEKNLALTIWEGRRMIEAARKYERIVQAGFQNRSGPYARSARAYLQSGKLGRIVHVKVYNLLPDTGPWSPRPDGPVPAGLDWDLWLGPAPKVPYNAGRQSGWTNYWDYCGGTLSGDASHQLDLTRLVLGDPPHPQAVYCAGGRLAYDDPREVPDLQAITFDYGSFVMTCENGTFTPYLKKFSNEVRYGTQWPLWPHSSTRVEIYGTRQLMLLGRHGCGWQVFEADGKIVAQDKGYFPDKWHQPNFVECIRTRQRPNADVEQAHYSACLVHLGNIAYRTGRQRLVFDGAAERFVGHEEANALVRPRARPPFALPERV
jgi:predicted dehydrogenase